MKDGKGIELWPNGDSYEGEYRRDKMNGSGTLTTKSAKYVGTFSDGYKDGLGIMTFKDSSRYEGTFKKNRFHGRGAYAWADGKKYEGDWLNGEKNGQGITMLPNGEKHDGLYVANR